MDVSGTAKKDPEFGGQLPVWLNTHGALHPLVIVNSTSVSGFSPLGYSTLQKSNGFQKSTARELSGSLLINKLCPNYWWCSTEICY